MALRPMPPQVREIAEQVCARRGVRLAEVLSRRRHRPVVLARQEAMWSIRQLSGPAGAPAYTLARIASMFGRDHSSVSDAVRAHDALQRPAS